jgi:hypothetical protein
MVPVEEEKRGRIQFANADIEAGIRPRATLQRSNSQISIHSNRSRRGSIDPSNILPIQYRTV